MRSHFQLFHNTWQNRRDFPLVLDVKYALMEIQSHVYANEHIHPIFFGLCDTINVHEKTIVRNCLNYFEQNPEHLFKDVVNLYVFEKMIPKVIAYIHFCQRYGGTRGITQIESMNTPVSLRDAIYYLWMEELPNSIWLPFYEDHAAHAAYQERFNAKIQTHD